MLTGCFIHSLMYKFFFILMLFTFWHIFSKANTGGCFLCVMLLSEALVKKAGLVVIKSLSTCLFIEDFIFPSVVKLSLVGYEILG